MGRHRSGRGRRGGDGRLRGRIADRDLQGDRGVLGQHEWCFDQELFDRAAAGVQGQLGECGAGEQHRALDDMVGQPGLAVGGHASGEQDPIGTGDRDRGPEQGMDRGFGTRGGRQPVVLGWNG